MSTPRFLYHASAVGLSGEIRRPFHQHLDCQASTALPRYGGRAGALIKSFEIGGVLAHGGVSTRLSGLYNPELDAFETICQSTVTGLDIEKRLTADTLTSVVHSIHPALPPKPGEPPVQPSIKVKGSVATGVKIDGEEIVLKSLVDFYSQYDTLTGFGKYYEGDPVFRQQFETDCYVGKEEVLPDNVRHFFPWRRRSSSPTLHLHNHMAIVPLFRVMNQSRPGFEVYGNVIRVEGFGRFHFGELMIEGNRRRVMMLRAELGSPCEGEVNCSCTDGNGTSDPPGGGNP